MRNARWLHAICGKCWEHRHPGQPASRVKNPKAEYCCQCGAVSWSGIYVRADAVIMQCCPERKKSA